MFSKLKSLKTPMALLAGFVSSAAAGVALYDRFFPGDPAPNNVPREEHRPVAISDQRGETSVHAQLIEPIIERMNSRNCDVEQIDIIDFDEHQTPAAETNSGLDGHYIATTLSVAGYGGRTPISLQAKGNGKGPVAKSEAYDGLRRSIENQLNELIHCEERSE